MLTNTTEEWREEEGKKDIQYTKLLCGKIVGRNGEGEPRGCMAMRELEQKGQVTFSFDELYLYNIRHLVIDSKGFQFSVGYPVDKIAIKKNTHQID